ncbi:MAG: ComEC/Rec2 family competence protein [Patescibacteria group bacterium]
MKHWYVPAACWGLFFGVALGLLEGWVWWITWLLGGISVVWLIWWVRQKEIDFLVLLLFLIGGGILGYWRAEVWNSAVNQRQPEVWEGAVVVSAVRHREFGWEAVLQWDRPGPLSKTSADFKQAVNVGETFWARCELAPTETESLFDWGHADLAQGVAGECESVEVAEQNFWPSGQLPPLTWFTLKVLAAEMRGRLQQQIETTFQPPVSWLASGLLIGERAEWNTQFNQLFQRVGLSHIVALSGWNVTVLCGVLLWVLVRLGFGVRQAMWIGLAGVGAFVLMTGASASLVRAAVMAAVCATARMHARPQSPGRVLLLAAALMVFHNPAVLLWDVSFHLSVLATLALVSDGWAFLEGWQAPVWDTSQTVRASVAVTVLTLPYIIWKFERISVVAIPVNVIVLPLLPLACATSALAVGLSALGIHHPLITWLAALPLQLIIRSAQFSAQLPWASVSLESLF